MQGPEPRFEAKQTFGSALSTFYLNLFKIGNNLTLTILYHFAKLCKNLLKRTPDS